MAFYPARRSKNVNTRTLDRNRKFQVASAFRFMRNFLSAHPRQAAG
ncbi:MAG: hypothetical protein IJS14_02285 [Lentisphaeria bacterium]|nr:hypothetical protein [Lentisphaeria bacterium]